MWPVLGPHCKLQTGAAGAENVIRRSIGIVDVAREVERHCKRVFFLIKKREKRQITFYNHGHVLNSSSFFAICNKLWIMLDLTLLDWSAVISKESHKSIPKTCRKHRSKASIFPLSSRFWSKGERDPGGGSSLNISIYLSEISCFKSSALIP